MSNTISIIIPAYNEERYLAACLDSIAAQTVKPDEVIVVDNNSTDNTAKIAKNYPFVKIIKEPKQGLVFARTTGLNMANSDWLVRIDADARLKKDWLEGLKEAIAKNPNMAGFTGRGVFYDTPFPRLAGAVQVTFFQYLQLPAMGGYTLWGANMAIHSTAWQEIADLCCLRNDIDEDINLTLQLARLNKRVKYCRKLEASTSLRRDQTNPLQVARYISTWPRDYLVNGKPVAAVYIALLTLIVVVLASLVWCVMFPFARAASR